jgi:hypothetical protein
VKGLVLGVPDASASAITDTFCRAAHERGVIGVLRMSIVSLEGGIALTASRVTATTGVERSATLRVRTAAEGEQQVSQLVDKLTDASAPAPSPPSPPASPPSRPPPTPAPANPSPAEKAAPASKPLAEGAAPGETSLVVLRSPTSVQLQRREDGRWVTACLSPCNQALPTDSDYRIVDDGGKPHGAFRLKKWGPTTIEVSPRSQVLDGIAIVGIVVGFFVTYAGLVSNGNSGGAIALAGGGGLVGGTIALLANGAHYSVMPDERSTTAANARPLNVATTPKVADLAPRRGLAAPLLSFGF